jgi:hypothetical protein
MKLLLPIIFLLLSTWTFAQDKIYVLTNKAENADINYDLFQTFNDFQIYKNDGLKKAFEPVDGKFTTYTFISEYKGLSFDETEKLFHDYLILKVDPGTNEIIDGYQYTMEWAEPPAVSDLYRVTATGQKLENQMNLNELKMELESHYKSKSREKLKDKGQLKLK